MFGLQSIENQPFRLVFVFLIRYGSGRMIIFVFDKSEFILLEARKYNRNRIILFVAFSLLTLGLCLYCTMAYYSIGIEIINSLSYDADSVSDAVVKILKRE